jgi:MFS family permease
LLAGALVNRMGGFVVPLIAIYLTTERGLSPTTAGLVIAAYGAGSLLSGPTGGMLADRFGRRRTMLLAFVWGAAAMLVVPFAQSVPQLVLAVLHLGFANDLYRPAVQAAVADLCPPDQRTRAYGLLYWAVNLGFGVAAALGGLLARRGFGRLFVIDAASTLAFGAIVALFVEETRPRRAPAEAVARNEDGSFADIVRDRALVMLLVAQAFVSVQFIQSHGALPVALAQRGIAADKYGLIIGTNGLYIVLFQPFVIGIVTRMRRTRALALGAILVGVGYGLNAPMLGVAGAAASVLVWTFGELCVSPVTPAVLAELAPPHLRARYQGMQQLAWGFTALVGPPAGLWVFEHVGARALWGICFTFGLIAASLNLLNTARLRARIGDKA